MNSTTKDHFTFNVHNSALVVGQTGSGKTELVRQYIRRIERAYTPDQMKYVLFDLKQVEFDPSWDGGAKMEYLYTPVRTGTPDDMDYLEELAELAKTRATQDMPIPFLFIYIEECDLAVQYPGRFHEAVITINNNANAANMKLIFSTSRPSRDIITPELRDSFDLILSGVLASHADEETLATRGSLTTHDFMVKEQRSY